jgi:NAD-dependent deacetylase
VHHLHGSLFEFRCDRCGKPFTGQLPAMPEPVEVIEPPRCDCGGLIRPDVVWFGEGLPDDAWDAAVQAVAGADVVIVVGTSSIVYPAAGLPEAALANGIPVIEVNPQATPLSAAATAVVREPAALALPGLLQRLPALLG